MKRLNKGSALLITLLIMVILSLTGISFLFMADTENKISNNYYLAIKGLLAAQSGVYFVSSWFNHANDDLTLLPTASDIAFNPRPNVSDGTNNSTLYKWGCATGEGAPNPDCSNYKLFDRPYIGTNGNSTCYHRFFGTSDVPDILISYANDFSRNFLDQVNDLLLGSSSGPVRISEIKLYSPPVAPNPNEPWNSNNIPYGICTVEVTAETINSTGEVLSTRRVKGIITDINYAIAGVALDVDGFIEMNGACMVHWGTMKATGRINDNNVQHLDPGIPWYVTEKNIIQPCGTLFGYYIDDSNFDQPLQGKILFDPWAVVRSRDTVFYQKKALNVPDCSSKTPKNDVDHWLLEEPPFFDDVSLSGYSCEYIYNQAENKNLRIKMGKVPGTNYNYYECKECTGNVTDTDCPGIDDYTDCIATNTEAEFATLRHNPSIFYNVFGCDPTVGFANAFRGYTYWKNIITNVVKQGGSGDVYYLVPGGFPEVGGLCSLGQWGPPYTSDDENCNTFEEWTSGKMGFWFFDTKDGNFPEVTGGNIPDGVDVKGQYWSGGFQYICAKEYDSSGGTQHDFEDCKFPGDPLWENMDPNWIGYRNNSYDPGNSVDRFIDRFINIKYPTDYRTFEFEVDENYGDTASGISKGWDKYGPTFTFNGYYKGILYLTGTFRARGNREFYGSVMVWNADADAAGTIEVWYDPELMEGVTQNLPTAFVEQIITDM